MTLRILSLAEADLLNGFRFYERQSSGVGLYFLDHLLRISSRCDSMRGFTERFLATIERFRKRFPFAVYYDLHEDEIRVWRVLDCRRDPYWIKVRLRQARRTR